MCWRASNITPVPKSGSANSCPFGYRPIIITLSCLFILFYFFLAFVG